jgi:hypothetical protein
VVTVAVVVGLMLIALGAFGSWRVYCADSETPARRMIAIVSMLACAVYTMAVILPFIAALVIPRCWQ